MKNIGIGIGILFLVVFGIPTIVIFGGGFYTPSLLENIEVSGGLQPRSEEQEMRDMIEILGATISHTQQMENIKAHAVIVRTYLARREEEDIQEGVLPHITYEDMKDLFGESFEEIYTRYEQAIEETAGELIFYEDVLIEPIYHKESAGYTRTGESLYNLEIPYLQSVESSGDVIEEEKVVIKTELIKMLEQKYPHIVINHQNIEHQIQVVEKDDAGYIGSIQIGNVVMDGEAFRTLVGLNSTCFTIQGLGDVFIFKVKGVGHGGGLSQNGANLMAEQGATYKQLLEYYYQGVEIK